MATIYVGNILAGRTQNYRTVWNRKMNGERARDSYRYPLDSIDDGMGGMGSWRLTSQTTTIH